MAKAADILKELEGLGVLRDAPKKEALPPQQPALARRVQSMREEPEEFEEEPEAEESVAAEPESTEVLAQFVAHLDSVESALIGMLEWCQGLKAQMGVGAEEPDEGDEDYEEEGLERAEASALGEARVAAPDDAAREEDEQAVSESAEVASNMVVDDDAPMEPPVVKVSAAADDEEIGSDDLKAALQAQKLEDAATAQSTGIEALKAQFLSPDALVTNDAIKGRLSFKDRLRSLVKR